VPFNATKCLTLIVSVCFTLNCIKTAAVEASPIFKIAPLLTQSYFTGNQKKLRRGDVANVRGDMKKHGAGAGNWGQIGDELLEERLDKLL